MVDEEMGFAGTPASDGMRPKAGELLRAARIERGLDLQQVAEQTRVRHRFLQAIEDGEYAVLPALPYATGFVKSYARAVGAPADAIAAQFRAEAGQVGQAPMVAPQLEAVDESRVPSRSLVAIAAVALIAVIAALSAWGAGLFESTPPEPVVAAAPAAVEPPVPAEPQNMVVEPAVQPAAAPVSAPVVPTTDPTLAAAVPPAATVPGAAAPIAAGGPVVISANEEAWIKVYDRATRQSVKMGILKPGERYLVPADRTDLLLWTGKAGALQISVGGRALPPLGGPQEMVRDVSLTPADLLARAG